MKKLLFILGVFVFLSACQSTEVEYLEVFDPFINDVPNNSNSFGSIVYYNPSTQQIVHINSETKQSTAVVSNASAAYHLCLSFDKEKFAYINGNGNVEIRNIDGTFIEQIDGTNNIADVNWAPDNKSLVYLEDNVIKVWGNYGYSLPSFVPISNGQKIDLSVSASNDIAVSYLFSQSFYYFKYIYIYWNGGSQDDIEIPYYLPDNINFSVSSNNYLSLYGNSSLGEGNDIFYTAPGNIYLSKTITDSDTYNSIYNGSEDRVEFVRSSSGFVDLYLYDSQLGYLKLTNLQNASLQFLNFDWRL